MPQPKGFYDKILVMDAETSGLAFNSDDPSHDPCTGEVYQSVSWGLVVADAQTLKPIAKLYVEIKWDGISTWSDKAQSVHGLTKDYLEEHGLTEEEAACEIASFVLDHFDADAMVPVAGHNAGTFDIFFMRRLLRKYEIMFRTGNRFIDTNTIGFTVFGTFNSDDLFTMIGVKRTEHNALEDAMASLRVLHKTRQLANTILG